jgi:hypothetical protein
LASGNWHFQVRRKTRYVAETFRRRKDGEEWRSKWSATLIAAGAQDYGSAGSPRRLEN